MWGSARGGEGLGHEARETAEHGAGRAGDMTLPEWRRGVEQERGRGIHEYIHDHPQDAGDQRDLRAHAGATGMGGFSTPGGGGVDTAVWLDPPPKRLD